MFKKLFGSTTLAVQQETTAAPARTSLIDLTKKAQISLEKHGLDGQRAAVYLVLDRSGSMRPYFNDGTVQHLAEQALGLSANLDDDGDVPVIFFSTDVDGSTMVTVDNYEGEIERTHRRLGAMGATYYERAIATVIRHYQQCGATDPALVIFQSDGNPSNQAAAKKALREAARLPMFWAFVGFGDRVDFLAKAKDLDGRKVNGRPVRNIGFFHAVDPYQVTDERLYDGLTSGFGPWLADARAAGILS